jgi:hypothetical protein
MLLNGNYHQGTPSIECPDGRWIRVERSSLQPLGICADDLVCVRPAGEWPRQGPVVIYEDGIQKIGYCVMNSSGNLDINLGDGSTLHWVSRIHGSHLVGWVARLMRFYDDPPAFRPLELVSRPVNIHKGEILRNGKRPTGLNLQK